MSTIWPATSCDGWAETCDTLRAHAQVLGKLAVWLAPPEPELHHAALRLTARGWETSALPAPNGTGAFGVVLDEHAHYDSLTSLACRPIAAARATTGRSLGGDR